MPVSEIDKIKIEVRDASDNISADADGLLRWSLDLGPLDVQTIKYCYVLSQHPSTY